MIKMLYVFKIVTEKEQQISNKISGFYCVKTSSEARGTFTNSALNL